VLRLALEDAFSVVCQYSCQGQETFTPRLTTRPGIIIIKQTTLLNVNITNYFTTSWRKVWTVI